MGFKFNPITGQLDLVSDTSSFVVGPSSATDNAIVRYDGTTGKLIQNSTTSTIADDGSVVLASDVTPLSVNKTTQAGNLFYTMTSASTTISPNPVPFIASASAQAALNEAYRAFDRSTTEKWTTITALPAWVKYNFNTSGGAIGYFYSVTGCIVGQETLAIKTWTFEGSNDDTNWTVLDTQTNAPAWTGLETRTYAIATPARYRYYRINISANQGSSFTTVLELFLRPSGSLFKSTVAQTEINGGETDGNVALITSSSRDLTLQATGDLYGTVRMMLRARFGTTGAVFENTSLDLVDFGFLPNSAVQGNIRWEHRSGSVLTANTGGEFQLINPSTTVLYNRIGENSYHYSGSAFSVGVNDATVHANFARARAGNGVSVKIENTQSAGAAQYAQLVVRADASATTSLYINQLSSSWVTSGINTAGGSAIEGAGAGGISIGSTNATGTLRFFAGGTTERARFDVSGKLGIGVTPTAFLHLLAGTTAANTAPIKLTSGTNMTAAEAGAIEFTTDDLFFTITTGAARKAFILDDGTRLTSGRVPFATTNGRLTDDADMTFATDTLSVTKASVKAGTGAGTIARVGGALPMDNFADVSVGGAEADIYTYTTPANTFGTNGDKLTATYAGNFVTVGTELTQLKVYFAGTAIWDSTGVAPTTGTTSWRVTTELIRVSSTVVRYTTSLQTTGASGFVYCTVGELTGLTLSGTNIIKITGTSSGVGSGAGDIVGKMSFGEFKPVA